MRPYPTDTLEDALAVAVAIQESNAGLPFDRVLLAGALGTTPASSGYIIRLNSSAKYGLTQGAYNDESISLTARGEAISAPRGASERSRALVEAAMHPEPFRLFYMTLNGRRIPEDRYAQNMLQRELGISPDLTEECLTIIKSNGLYAGLLREVAGRLEVELPSDPMPVETGDAEASQAPEAAAYEGLEPRRSPRIFVGESARSEAVDLALQVLTEFDIAHGTAIRTAGDDSPISSSASEVMRECTAAVLVIAEDDMRNGASAEWERSLYQIGAASLLYGQSIVVLCERGVQLPREARRYPQVRFDANSTQDAAYGLLRELHTIGAIRVGL